MKKAIQGFILGVIITTLLLFNLSFFADSVFQTIQVVFNKINVTVNGKPIHSDNILYDNTTYVPLRAVAEMLGKKVGWDSNTNTASINDIAVKDEVMTDEKKKIENEQKYKSVGGEYAPVVNINGNMYLFGYAPYFIVDENNNYYLRFDLEPLNQILSIAYNQYNIKESNNPYVKGYIEEKYPFAYNSEKNIWESRYIEVEEKYINVSQTYSTYKIYNSDKTKFYEISMKVGGETGIVKINSETFIPFNDLMDTLGEIQFYTETDEENKMQIFSFN